MKCDDIEQFTSSGAYRVDFSFVGLSKAIDDYVTALGLITDPDFQRGHVWTKEQQSAFVEYFLRGGKSGTTIYLNHPNWRTFKTKVDGYNDFTLVDGLQRITAVKAFLAGEIPAFGVYIKDFEDDWIMDDYVHHKFTVCINDLQSKEEVLKWYIDMNKGGTPHTREEIAKVEELLREEIEQTEEIDR